MSETITLHRATVQQALEALEYIRSTTVWQADKHAANPAINALKAALEQPERWVKSYCGGKPNYTTPTEQEPVAWRTFDGEGGYDYRTYDDNENYRDEWDRRNPNHKGWVEPLYTHPPRREWQFLSAEERYRIADESASTIVAVLATEAALKEKNHE